MKPFDKPNEQKPPPQFWWQMLPAIPLDRDSHEYHRLRRVWFDHTWANHPFMQTHHENHLTATLFENFVLFEPDRWLRRLIELAGLPSPLGPLTQCRWGYEVTDAKTSKTADVAIHARDSLGDLLVVVEAKSKDGSLKKSDIDPASYLDLAEFAWAERRQLIYLVDEANAETTRVLVTDPLHRSGVITWQALAGLQIELALELEHPSHLRGFIAGAIQFQYLTRNITPSRLIAAYLGKEPSRSEITAANPDKMTSWRTDWRLEDMGDTA